MARLARYRPYLLEAAQVISTKRCSRSEAGQAPWPGSPRRWGELSLSLADELAQERLGLVLEVSGGAACCCPDAEVNASATASPNNGNLQRRLPGDPTATRRRPALFRPSLLEDDPGRGWQKPRSGFFRHPRRSCWSGAKPMAWKRSAIHRVPADRRSSAVGSLSEARYYEDRRRYQPSPEDLRCQSEVSRLAQQRTSVDKCIKGG